MTFIDEQPLHPRQIGAYYCLVNIQNATLYQRMGSLAFSYSPCEGEERGLYLHMEHLKSAQTHRDFYIEQATKFLERHHSDCEWHLTTVPPNNPEDANEGAHAFVIRIYRKENTNA